MEGSALNPRRNIGLVQARGQVEPVGLAGDSDAVAQKDQEQELRLKRIKSRSSDSSEQRARKLTFIGAEASTQFSQTCQLLTLSPT